MRLTALLIETYDRKYVAINPETISRAHGDTPEEALANLRAETIHYLRDCALMVTRGTEITTFDVSPDEFLPDFP
jgi:hypothetical protein